MSRPIRVVQVITKLDVGGAQETVVLTCRSLPRERFALSVVAGPEQGAGGGELRSEIERSGTPVSVEPALRRAIHPIRDVLAVVHLWRRWARERPDIVHTHSSKAGVVGRAAATLARVPVRVHTVHGWSFREHQRRTSQRVFLGVERVLARTTTAIIAVSSRDIEDGLMRRIGRRSQYHLIRSGVDLRRFDGSERQVSSGDRLMTVTRFASPKDLTTLLRAMSDLPVSTVLDVVGEGPEFERHRREVRELGLDERVRFLGVRRDVPDLLATADVFVLSTRSEGVPRAVLEAMAVGLPVVASDVGGVSEAITDGREGLLVPPGDERALAKAIACLLENRVFARDLGAAARERVRAFSSDQTVEQLASLYEGLVRP
jgi:glycosyltransferase involved in cell wall biosynthesis